MLWRRYVIKPFTVRRSVTLSYLCSPDGKKMDRQTKGYFVTRQVVVRSNQMVGGGRENQWRLDSEF